MMRSAVSKSPNVGSAGSQLLASIGRSERRSSVRLYKNWDAARAGTSLPRLVDFNLSVLEELGSSSFLLVVGQEEELPRFRYFGRAIAAEIGRDLTGRPISEVPLSSLLSCILAPYMQAPEGQKVLALNGRFQSSHEDLFYRGILLPFSSDAVKVDAVLGCYRSRPAKAAARRMGDVIAPAAPGTQLLGEG